MSGSVIKTFADERPLAYKLGISIHFSQALCGSCRGKLYCSRDISKPQTIKFPRGTLPSLSSLFPLPIVPRALSFSFSPASPQHKKASAEERGVTLQNKVLNNETPEYLKGQCPDYAHARASSVFSLKDNRTVILTRQDFLPDHTADGNLSFIFSSNILDFRRSHLSYIKNWLAFRDFFSRFYR